MGNDFAFIRFQMNFTEVKSEWLQFLQSYQYIDVILFGQVVCQIFQKLIARVGCILKRKKTYFRVVCYGYNAIIKIVFN